MTSFADIRNHRHHGLFAAIIIEPKDTINLHSSHFMHKDCQEQKLIQLKYNRSFQEFVLFAQNGIRLLDKNNQLIRTTLNNEVVDHEDTGEKGYNYRSERLINRLKIVPIIHKVFNSKVHCDPATPILKAMTKQPVIIRLFMSGDKPRNISFLVHGHQWKSQNNEELSRILAIQGAISVGSSYNIQLLEGANQRPGDYLYRSRSNRWDLESGMWGILRIRKRRSKRCYQCICKHLCLWKSKKEDRK